MYPTEQYHYLTFNKYIYCKKNLWKKSKCVYYKHPEVSYSTSAPSRFFMFLGGVCIVNSFPVLCGFCFLFLLLNCIFHVLLSVVLVPSQVFLVYRPNRRYIWKGAMISYMPKPTAALTIECVKICNYFQAIKMTIKFLFFHVLVYILPHTDLIARLKCSIVLC